MKVPPAEQVSGVILAGGRGRRMGGRDKGLVELAGRPLIEHVLEGLRPQVGRILINVNRNRERYAAYGESLVGDALDGFQGPLAGFAAAMQACATPWILTVPCDGPRVPPRLLERLGRALAEADAELAVAHDGQRLQPVYALLGVNLYPSLQAFLQAGDRKIDLWYARHRMATADFSDCQEVFRNINTPQQREEFAMQQGRE